MTGVDFLAALATMLLVVFAWRTDVADLLRRGLAHVGYWANDRAMPRLSAMAAWGLSTLCRGPHISATSLLLRAYADSDRGQNGSAIKIVRRLLDQLVSVPQEARTCPWWIVAGAVDLLASAGLYREAVAVPLRWSADAQRLGRDIYPNEYVIAQVNISDALHRQGHHDAALENLADIRACCADSPLAQTALRLTMAEILLHSGADPCAAGAILRAVAPASLSRRAMADYHYTMALILARLGRLDEAEMQVRQGHRLARRAVSQRNALYVSGVLALARGDSQAAIDSLSAVARHPCREQTALALVLLGDTYERAGNWVRAREAYTLAIERDAESFAATTAAEHLRSPTEHSK